MIIKMMCVNGCGRKIDRGLKYCKVCRKDSLHSALSRIRVSNGKPERKVLLQRGNIQHLTRLSMSKYTQNSRRMRKSQETVGHQAVATVELSQFGFCTPPHVKNGMGVA